MKHLKKYQAAYDLNDAVNDGDINTVKNILKYEFIDIDYQSGTRGDTPLLFATYRKNIPIIKMLIEAGADVNKSNDNYWTPLFVSSVYSFDSELCKIFVDAGANFNVKVDNFYMFDNLSKDHQNILIEKFPELYKDFLTHKEADKYNL